MTSGCGQRPSQRQPSVTPPPVTHSATHRCLPGTRPPDHSHTRPRPPPVYRRSRHAACHPTRTDRAGARRGARIRPAGRHTPTMARPTRSRPAHRPRAGRAPGTARRAGAGPGPGVRWPPAHSREGPHERWAAGTRHPDGARTAPRRVERKAVGGVRAVLMEEFGGRRGTRGARPGAAAGRRRRAGRGDRPVPQRLARLAGPRPGHRAAARARTRARRASSRRSAPTSAAGRSATGSPCRSSAPAGAAPPAWPATSRCATGRPSPASPHWGSFAELRGARPRRRQPRRAARRAGVATRGRAGLPVRHRLPRRRRRRAGCGRASGSPCTAAAVSGCPRS